MKKNLSVIKSGLPYLLLLFVFIIRLQMLLSSKEPAGLDGYFYALQAKSFALKGVLENPDYKIGYYLCGIFAFAFKDPILGCKIYASLISAFLVFSTFSTLKALKVEFPLSIFGAVLCAAAFSTSSMCINFINNLTGITFFLFYAASVFSLSASEKTRPIKFIPAVVFFILCLASHLVSAAFAFIFTVLMVLRKLNFKLQLSLLAASLLLGILFFSRQLPRFNSVFALSPVLPVFSSFMKKSIGFRISLELSLLFLTSWIIFFAALFNSIKNKSFDILIFFIPVLFFPFWNLNILDMGYRMLLSAVPCGIIILVFAFSKIDFQKKTIVFGILSLAIVPFVFTTKSVYDAKKDPPYAHYRKIVSKIDLPDDSLLIAHLGLNHVYTYYNNLRDALNYVPDFPVEKEKLWRIAWGVNPFAIEEKLYDETEETLEELIKPLDSSYILIREDLWQKFLSREEEIYVENYNNWFNPHTVRPAFIRKPRKK